MTESMPTNQLPEVLNAIIKHCAAYGQPSRQFLLNILTEFEAVSRQQRAEEERSKQVITELRMEIREDGTRTFNGMPDYEYLKIAQLTRIADFLEQLTKGT